MQSFVSSVIMRLGGGQVYLSFSGGKDSTVLAELIKWADLPTHIPFVFANTGIEFDATKRFVDEYDWDNKVIVKPRKPFGQILKEYGKPTISKVRSEHLSTYQNNINAPFSTARTRQMITGEAERGGVKEGFRSRFALAQKHFHLLHPDLDYKVANKCCTYMKKLPFADYSKENNMNGTFVGVRTAEGGIRQQAYKTCVMVKKKSGGRTEIFSMPIIDWTDEMVNEFIEHFDVKISDAYTVYGLQRTGCIGCPFNKDVGQDLTALKSYEPQKYKAVMHWFKDVYADLGVIVPDDVEYMTYFEERNKLNETRRKEMWEKFKPEFNPAIRKRDLE